MSPDELLANEQAQEHAARHAEEARREATAKAEAALLAQRLGALLTSPDIQYFHTLIREEILAREHTRVFTLTLSAEARNIATHRHEIVEEILTLLQRKHAEHAARAGLLEARE